MALSLARKKLKYSAFIEFNRHLLEYFYANFKEINTWHGFNLLAIDGSTQKLFKYKDVRKHFGEMNLKKGGPCPMARISQMFDVLNKVTIDAILSPYHVGERELLKNHLLNLLPNDLLLLDRGYPAYWVFSLILSQGGNFCARISSQWKIVQNFIQSGDSETFIDLHASQASKNECIEMGIDTTPLHLRLIRVALDNGEVEVLITSLLDNQEHTQALFKDLYHKRWPVETDYLFMKERLQIGNFSGETALSVYQDFHAKIVAKNLSVILAFPVQKTVKKNSENKKYSQQLNMTQVFSKSKDTVILLFDRSYETVLQMINELHSLFMAATEPIRPGRKFKRNHKVNKRECYMNSKPCR